MGIFKQEALEYLARIIAFATAIPFHEAAHAFVSDKLGDPTARSQGRLTLNPLKHIDPLGLIAMLLVGVGWAKPVPINPTYYKNRKYGMALTALAGPLANFLLGFFFFLLFRLLITLFVGTQVISIITTVCFYLSVININLAVFNLLPVPPFDGSRIFSIFLPEKWYFGIQKYERFIMYGVLALIVIVPRVTGFNPIGNLLSVTNNAIISFFLAITNWLPFA